jgi:hypothetical protein
MSKENVIRFLMMKDKDESIKNAFDAIMGKYEGGNLSEDERGKMLQEEIIPLAKEYGYDFAPEDLKELQQPETYKLSDEELDGVTGGRGQYVHVSVTHGSTLYTITLSCEFAPNDDIFRCYFNQDSNNCYEFVPTSPNRYPHACMRCANMRVLRNEQEISIQP